MSTPSAGPFRGTLLDPAGNRLVISERGVDLVFAAGPVDSPKPPIPGGGDPGGRQLSVYLKMWPNGRLPGLSAAAKPGVTELRLAFLQGSGRLVGWGSQDAARAKRDAAELHERGVLLTGSIGGEHGAVNLADRAGWLANIATLHSQIGLDRIDVDVEASALRGDDVLWLSDAVYGRYGILTTMAPNGSNVGQYLPVAVELHRRKLLAAYGQQFYGSRGGVSLGGARGRIVESVGAGIPARLTQVGMWVGSGDLRQWPMATCEANLREIHAEWPDIGGAYLWSEGHGEVAEWARRMAGALD